jgi:hypothetical protein
LLTKDWDREVQLFTLAAELMVLVAAAQPSVPRLHQPVVTASVLLPLETTRMPIDKASTLRCQALGRTRSFHQSLVLLLI